MVVTFASVILCYDYYYNSSYNPKDWYIIRWLLNNNYAILDEECQLLISKYVKIQPVIYGLVEYIIVGLINSVKANERVK